MNLKRVSVFILSVFALGSLSSCSFLWDEQGKQDAKIAFIAVSVSSRVRQDPSPPQREKMYRAAETVLSELITSGNTDSQYLATRLEKEFLKWFSPAVSSALTKGIMADITSLAGSGDPAKVLAAEITMRDGIHLGLGQRPAVSSYHK